MKQSLTHRLDQILKLWEPKIELFYAAHAPDMWVKSIDDFEEAYCKGDEKITLQALAILEYRRKKMLDIYRSFTELTQPGPATNPVIESILENLYSGSDENSKRASIKCDTCGAGTAYSGGMAIKCSETTNEYGDPEFRFHTRCDACMKKQTT